MKPKDAEREHVHREQALQDLLASRRYGRYLTTHYTGRLPLDAPQGAWRR